MVFSEKHKVWLFVLFFGLIVIAVGYLIAPYIPALLLGGLVAYFLHPLYLRIAAMVRNKLLAQIIVVAGMGIILLLILGGIFVPVVVQAVGVYENAETYAVTFNTFVENCVEEESMICSVLDFLHTPALTLKARELLQKSVSFLVTSIGSLVQGIVSTGLFIVVMGFSISYFLDHGKDIKETIMKLLPLRVQDKNKIMQRLEETMNAVIMGNVSTSLLQGIVGGIIFAVAGMPAAAFFGFLMAILAFIPAVGPALLWLPAAIYVGVVDSVLKGVLMSVACLFLLGGIDNFIKPKLIGDKLKLSSFAVFLGVLGGLKLFGIFGLILGPVLFALLVTCVSIYQEMSE